MPKTTPAKAEPPITTVVTKTVRDLVTVVASESTQTLPGKQQYSSYKHTGFVSKEYLNDGLDIHAASEEVVGMSQVVLYDAIRKHREAEAARIQEEHLSAASQPTTNG